MSKCQLFLHSIRMFILTCLISSAGAADTSLPPPCVTYLEMLQSGNVDPLAVNADDCILMEQLVISANSWQAYIDAYNEQVGSETFANLLSRAFDSQAQGDYASAYLYSDAAKNSAIYLFARLGDVERFNFYVHVLSRWRDQNLENSEISEMFLLITDQRFGSVASVSPFIDHETLFTKHMKTYLKCLILIDAFTVSLDNVLKSEAFRACN